MGASDLPLASARAIVRCLCERYGLINVKRSKNHYILRRGFIQISIPDHREVKRELLAHELKLVGIDHKEFTKKFKE